MPATWIGLGAHGVSENIVDALVSILRLDVAYVRLQPSGEKQVVEASRGELWEDFPGWLQDHVEGQQTGWVGSFGCLRVTLTPLGLQGEDGVLLTACSRSDYPGQIDKQLISVAANQAVITFHLQWAQMQLAESYNAFRLSQQKELELAAFIQQGLMAAAKLPQLPFAQVKAHNVPCKEIGGDFFMATAIDEDLLLAIADVSGKGVPAAIMASVLQGMMQSDLLSRVPLPEIARGANRFFTTRDLGSKYATLVIARIQPDGRLDYLNCAHVPPLIVSAAGGVSRLKETNLPVGLLQGSQYEAATCYLRPGDHLVLVTDGVTDAQTPADDSFGDERLEESARGEQPLAQIFSTLHDFCEGRPMDDDCTVVELTYAG